MEPARPTHATRLNDVRRDRFVSDTMELVVVRLCLNTVKLRVSV